MRFVQWARRLLELYVSDPTEPVMSDRNSCLPLKRLGRQPIRCRYCGLTRDQVEYYSMSYCCYVDVESAFAADEVVL